MGDPGPLHYFPVLDVRLPEYVPQIDLLKAFAVISVIVMHTFPTETVLAWGSPYYLWQAVPLFILIAGFTGAYGFRKRDAVSLKQCYDLRILARRYSRLLAPFVILWILEVILLLSLNLIPSDAWSLTVNFLSGGTGWGSFFVPVILQSILIVPALYFIARRNPDLMVGAALCLNIAFEAIMVLSGNTNISSFLYLRYLTAGALGVWLVTSTKPHGTGILIAGISGFIFLTLASYTAVFPASSIFYRYNGALQFPSFAWTLILTMVGLKYLQGGAASRLFTFFAGIGKASWHIFLFQMFYFLFPAGFFYALFSTLWAGIYGDILEPPFLGFLSIPDLSLEIALILLNVAICVSVGYAWYASGGKITRRMAGFLHAH
jgi:peptidoglycan/LPS O-acetylase OafA/YrhL